MANSKIPEDNDFINDRLWDIIFYDKIQYGEKSANMITDYLDFIDKIKNMASNSSDKKIIDKIKEIEEEYVKNSTKRSGEKRRYKDLIKGRFRVYVHRIEKTDDVNSIAGKSFDFSKKTIEELIEMGKKDCEEKVNWKQVEGLAKIRDNLV